MTTILMKAKCDKKIVKREKETAKNKTKQKTKTKNEETRGD